MAYLGTGVTIVYLDCPGEHIPMYPSDMVPPIFILKASTER